jgi:hypothetical protein
MKTRVEKIEDYLKGLNVENLNILDYVDASQVNSFDDVLESIENAAGFDVEIIYYASAMKYLTENDTSLRESLQIACDMGFKVSALSSETLASLLASQNCREEFCELESEIDDFFNELEDDENE